MTDTMATPQAAGADERLPSLEAIWHHHRHEVEAFVQRRTPSQSCADDVVSETFACAATALNRGVPVDIRWLLTVARRRVADYWRQVARVDGLARRLSFDRCKGLSDGLAREHGEALSYDLVKVLVAMPERQRRALYLRYIVGLSVDGVATQLSASYRATESLLARGRTNIRAELERCSAAPAAPPLDRP